MRSYPLKYDKGKMFIKELLDQIYNKTTKIVRITELVTEF